MTKSLSSILLVLILAAAALAGPPALAEEAAARPAAAGFDSAAPATEPPAESEEALFLADTSCAPVSGGETASLGEAQEPLFAGTPCNERRCGPREFCCNFSCSICASIFGGACTQQVCPIRP